MSQAKTAGQKHVPLRMCVGCREALAKRALVRVVRDPDGVRVDPGGKASGRGAYVHDRRECWEHALRGPLEQALKTEISAADRELLVGSMNRLAPEADKPADPPPARGGAA